MLLLGAAGCQDPNGDENGDVAETPPTGACCGESPNNCTVTTEDACREGTYKGDGTDCELSDCYVGEKKFQLTICQCASIEGATTTSAPWPAPGGCSPLPCNPAPINQQSQITTTNNPTSIIDRQVSGATCREAYANVGNPAGITESSPGYQTLNYRRSPLQCPNQKWVVRMRVNTGTLEQDITITVPKWSAPPAAPQADKTAFDNWRTRLLQHERQHEQIDKNSLAAKYKAKIQDNEMAVACHDTLQKASEAAQKKVDSQILAAFMEAWNEVEQDQAQLDQPPGYPIVLNCP